MKNKMMMMLFAGMLTAGFMWLPIDDDAAFIEKIYKHSLTQGKAFNWLTTLTEKAPHRLSGSPEAAAAVELMKQVLDTLSFDKVSLQPCIVPYWVRGEKEQARIISTLSGTEELTVLALGNSVGTGGLGISAEVVEVSTPEEIEKKGASLNGKIVFINMPFDNSLVSTFEAYGCAVKSRVRGPEIASKMGAVGVVVRSMTNKIDDEAHTGVTIFEAAKPIPAVAVSTKDAEMLHRVLQQDPKARIWLKTDCQNRGQVKSFNVVAEIKGSEKPDEIILVGGHLDAWDVCDGAHDDGAGCVHSIQALRTLKQLGYRPKRTLRCVLFMNEENGGQGAKAYADSSNLKKEYHFAAIESDAGGFTPRGFTAEKHDGVPTALFNAFKGLEPMFAKYGITLSQGGSGADVASLKSQNGLLIGLRPDSQRYFDHHHAHTDHIEAVNERELLLGAAAMSTLVYLLDNLEIKEK